MGTPTAEELSVLRQFRKKISDLELAEEQLTDDALLKWLRARELDLEKSNDMLRKTLKWREENDIANILSWKPPESFHKEYPFEIYGYTRSGCPILGADVGTWDFRKAAEDPEKLKIFLKYFDFMLAQVFERMKNYKEECLQGIRKSPEFIETQFVTILDYGGFSIRQLTSFASLTAIRSIVQRFEGNYPEVLKTMYILNASWIFLSVFKIMKPFLTDRTLQKIQIYGHDEEEWKSVLLRNIPANQFPSQYGGTYNERV